MSRFWILCVSISASLTLASIAPALPQEHGEECSYSVLHNGPTWDSQAMQIPYDVVALAWARDGAYSGSGRSYGRGLHSGGAGVAVASVSYWFKVTHHAVATCAPVQFDSDAELHAEVSTSIYGDHDDYALAAGFQAIGGDALQPASVAVAATNSGSPVQNSTVSIGFGHVGFTMTIPGVSVTTDTVDQDRKTISTAGKKKIEEELITVNCWTKIKVVTNGPFGGTASASVDSSSVTASTLSKCTVHGQTGAFTHWASE